LPLDPENIVFNTVFEDSKPPLQAYYYMNPSKLSFLSMLDRNIRKESAKSNDRLVFEGWSNLSEFEKQNLFQLKSLVT